MSRSHGWSCSCCLCMIRYDSVSTRLQVVNRERNVIFRCCFGAFFVSFCNRTERWWWEIGRFKAEFIHSIDSRHGTESLNHIFICFLAEFHHFRFTKHKLKIANRPQRLRPHANYMPKQQSHQSADWNEMKLTILIYGRRQITSRLTFP